jgi:hypothetical protein
MRMLYLGGLDVICDLKEMSPQHQFNPYGDFEMEAPLHHLLKHKNTWTKGAAIKVVCPYVVAVPGLPMDRKWKAIFMLRPIPEILASLAALKTVWEYEPQDAIRDCKKYLEMHNVDPLFVTYKEMVDYPKATAIRLVHYLDLDLDVDRMTTAVSRTPREDYKGGERFRGPREIIKFGGPLDSARQEEEKCIKEYHQQ